MLPMTKKNMIIHDFSLTRDCRTFPPGAGAESLNFTVGHPRLYLPPEGAGCGRPGPIVILPKKDCQLVSFFYFPRSRFCSIIFAKTICGQG